jgi:hypothetical protein
MEKALTHIVNNDGWLAAVAPDHLTRLSEVFLIVREDDEIIEGCNSIATWSK